ncbi:MAG: class I SAM-dependent methyltransferase [Bacteroidales bacterium]|nr:class I SAM-dependent methyltransferase [Bacteroidales bacterium]
MKIKNKLLGVGIEKMPALAFRCMTLTYRIMDFFYFDKNYLKSIGIQPGQTIIDYGCGPGRYTGMASALVGEKGTVYAVDIHEVAIQTVERKVKKFNLRNVKTVLAEGYHVNLPDKTADMVYAFDMFHMIADTDSFLKELHRLVKTNGQLIIEDGHQPRVSSRYKILKSGKWEIIEDTKDFMRCVPN